MRTKSRVSAAATACAVLAVGQALLSVAISHDRGVGWRAWADSNSATGALTAIGFAVVAVPVIRHETRNRLGWVFLLVAGLSATAVLAAELVDSATGAGRTSLAVTVGAWIGGNAWWVALLVLLGAVPWLFPDGRLPTGPWRTGFVAATVMTALLATVGIVSGELVVDQFPALASEIPAPFPARLAVGAGSAAYFLALLSGLAGTTRLVVRLRRSVGQQRSQLSWFVVACLVVIIVPNVPPAPWSGLVAVGLFPLCLGVAILRHGLFGGDRLLNRALVYGLLTGSVLGALAIGARVLGGGLAGSTGGLVLAALALAFGLAPLQRWVQHAVDRLLHVPPRDPYAALRTVTTQLSTRPGRGEQLDAIADAVARSLGVLEVQIVTTPEPEPPDHLAVPLHFAGERVGSLLVVVRPGQPRASLDHALLDDMAELVAVAVKTAALLAEARSMQEASLLALEEERRRIRADLHDGLGPALAGVTLSLSAVADSHQLKGTEAGAVLARLHTQTQSCLDDVQHIVHGLRPSALDGLGLVGALREHAASLSDASLTDFEVDLIDFREQEPVPAAVELAAYRVAMEAMTNVAVHARATRCRVQLAVGPESLTLTVRDDGVGLDANAAQHGGLGLQTMQKRAADLGGRTTLTSRPGSTSVCLDVPIPRAS